MAGVDLYFVISGFIITTMCMGHFGRSGEAWRFLWRRFLRIYPTYWVWCFAILAVFLVRPEMINSTHGRPNLLRSILLLPQQNLPLLLVSWTLVYEVFFYILFACALRWLREQNMAYALLSWAAVIVLGRSMFAASQSNPWLALLVSPLLLEFIMGCGLALYVRALSFKVALASLLLGVAGLMASMAVLAMHGSEFPPSWSWGRTLTFGTSSALIVAGVVALESCGWRCFPRSVEKLGDASYSLYLSHVPVVGIVGLLWRHLVPAPTPVVHAIALGSAFGTAMVGGFTSYWMIETPLTQVSRDWHDIAARLTCPLQARGCNDR